MNEKLNPEQIRGVLAALDDALAQGPWAASTFLTIIGRKLQSIRDDFANLYMKSDEHILAISSKLTSESQEKRSLLKKIYIALYAVDGSNLESWENIIANLPSQVISRPVYENEDDIKVMLRNKGNSVNEAYVSIYISPSSILDQLGEKVTVDKLGKPLIALKANAINLENLENFEHSSGTYQWVKGRLIKKMK